MLLPLLREGDRVEDNRPKNIFYPDPNDRYSNIFGTVIETDAFGFTVRWHVEKPYEMGYAWAFVEKGDIKRVRSDVPLLG